jgi:hypothetical protein
MRKGLRSAATAASPRQFMLADGRIRERCARRHVRARPSGSVVGCVFRALSAVLTNSFRLLAMLGQSVRDLLAEPSGEAQRVPAFFYLLSLHHRTLDNILRVQHPEQRPLPFRYVVAVVCGIADALEAAAGVGVVHLDMKEDNVMVDDQEAMEFEAEQIATAASTVHVDFGKCVRRFEKPPVAVVVDWGCALHFDAEWVLRVGVFDGKLVLPFEGRLWGNPSHASPELVISLRSASDELQVASVAVARAYRAKTVALQGSVPMNLPAACDIP